MDVDISWLEIVETFLLISEDLRGLYHISHSGAMKGTFLGNYMSI